MPVFQGQNAVLLRSLLLILLGLHLPAGRYDTKMNAKGVTTTTPHGEGSFGKDERSTRRYAGPRNLHYANVHSSKRKDDLPRRESDFWARSSSSKRAQPRSRLVDLPFGRRDLKNV
jgi:hypothetical protein